MPSSRPAVRFQDILDNIERIRSYVAGFDRDAFVADTRTRDAVERCLERVYEAAAKLGSQAEDLAPGPSWRSIRALGNVFRHAYDKIDPVRVWEIVAGDLPALADAAESALERLGAKPA